MWRGAFARFHQLGLSGEAILSALFRFVMRTRRDLPAEASVDGVDWNMMDGAIHFRTFSAVEYEHYPSEVLDRDSDRFPFPQYVQALQSIAEPCGMDGVVYLATPSPEPLEIFTAQSPWPLVRPVDHDEIGNPDPSKR